MLEYAPNANDGKKRLVSRGITVENSTHCGAKCIMCPRDEYDFAWSHMEGSLFQSVVDQAAELGLEHLNLSGFGDAFMDPNYESKLQYIRDNYPDIRLTTGTTGHLLHEGKINKIAELFDTLKISFYGHSKASYEAVHKGVLKFEKVSENIHNLCKIPSDQRPYVILTFLSFPENEHEINAWVEHWEPIADEVLVWRPHNFAGAKSVEDISFKTNSNQQSEKQISCGRPFNGDPSIRTNGDVTACCFDFNHKLVLGNLKEDTLVDILDGALMSRIKEVHTAKTFDGCGLLCDGCDQIYDRQDALIYASNTEREIDQKTAHPDRVLKYSS